MRIKIHFTKGEQELIKQIAKIRTDTDRALGFHNNWNEGKRSPYDIDLHGFGAEMAFAKFYNLYPDFSGELKKGSADLITWKRKKIDVKHSTIDNGQLLVKASKSQKKADVYVLVVGKFPDFEIVGFADKSVVFSSPVINNYGYCENYTVTELTEFNEFSIKLFKERYT